MGILFKNKAVIEPDYMRKKKAAEKRVGHLLTNEEFEEKYLALGDGSRLSDTGTSIFDPVLTETVINWFTAKDDFIIDPFAGGSVRGVISCLLGRHYIGVDLRGEQIEANIEQGKQLCNDIIPTWVTGNSLYIKELAQGEYDFILTCPPYGDLEVYSDDPADLSNMSDCDFDKVYADILFNTVSMLRNDRFACIVVGNYRDKKGYLRDLVGITVNAMEKAGARYYNDIIIATPIGSLPIRTGKQFSTTRKVGKCHQYCLIFVKGNPRKATERLGEIEIPDLNEYMDGTDE